jgi:hypothetical protein
VPIKDVSNAPFCDVPNLQHAVKNWDQGEELEVTHADLPILGARGKIFSIGTEAHATDVQVTVLVCFVIDEYANLMLVRCWYLELERTHQVFAPVFASKICAARLQPVARYFPSAENFTQHTTLSPRGVDVSNREVRRPIFHTFHDEACAQGLHRVRV